VRPTFEPCRDKVIEVSRSRVSIEITSRQIVTPPCLSKYLIWLIADASVEAVVTGDATDAGPRDEEVRLVQVEVRRPARHHQHLLRHRAATGLQGRVPQEAQGTNENSGINESMF
jgi:hypothetical protein